jgi:hypothetical protein
MGVDVTLAVGTAIGEAGTTGVGAASAEDGAAMGDALTGSVVIVGTGPLPPPPPQATSRIAAARA